MSTDPAQARTMGEILDAGVKIYTSHARVLMGLTATVVVPLQALSAAILFSTSTRASDIPSGNFAGLGAHASFHSSSLTANGILNLTQILVGLLTVAVCVKAVSDAYLGHPTGIGVSLRFTLRRLFSLIGLEITVVLGLIIAFLFFVVPGIWLYGAWAVATPALLIEGRGVIGALGRSHQLVEGQWWQTAGVLLVINLAAGIVGGIIEALPRAIVTRPLIASVRTVLYHSLRARKEGHDPDLLARQLGISASPTVTEAEAAFGR